MLVQRANGEPQVKVIDFGLARVLHPDDLEINSETRSGAILGSLWHMSPEQTIAGADVDTRTDVFLLGSLLYQLLTGECLLDRDTLESKDLARILTAIREQQPARPSQRIASPKLRPLRAEKTDFSSRLLSELDWAVMRAIEKEPDRRYQTVAELSADVRRFLNDEPINARPPSLAYSARKYFRRHKGFVLSIGSVLLALVATAVIATIGFLQVSDANEAAERRLSQARTSNAILSDIFADLDFSSADAATTPLRMQLAQRLVSASEKLSTESVGDRTEVGRLQLRLGKTLNSLGFYREAVPTCRAARETLRQSGGVLTASRDAGRQYGMSLFRSGDFVLAREVLFQVLDESENANEPVEALATRHLIGWSWYCEGDFDAAEDVVMPVVKGRTELLGASHPQTLRSKNLLARIYTSDKDARKAIPILFGCLAHHRARQPKHPATIQAISDLAWAYCQTPEREKGVVMADEAYQLARQVYGDAHEFTLNARVTVGLAEWATGDSESAREILVTAIRGLESFSTRESGSTVAASQILARLLVDSKQPELALPILQTNLRIRQDAVPVGHPSLVAALIELADVETQLGEYVKARALLKMAIESNERNTPRSDASGYRAARQMGSTWFAVGRFSEALDAFQTNREICEKAQGHFGFDTMLAYADCAKALSALNRAVDAIELLRDYLSDLEGEPEPLRLHRTIITAQLGIVLAQSGQVEHGIELMESVVHGGARLREMSYLIRELRLAYLKAGESDRLLGSVRRDLAMAEHRFGGDSRMMGVHLLSLGRDLIEFHQPELAKQHLDRSTEILIALDDSSWQTQNAPLLSRLAGIASVPSQNQADFDEELRAVEAAFVRARQTAAFPAQRRELSWVAQEVSRLLSLRGRAIGEWQQRADEGR